MNKQNIPQTPVYVGQYIPIYVVPDNTGENETTVRQNWKKTNWSFRIIAIRLEENERDQLFVDIRWPNDYIDTNIPIENVFGNYARIPESLIGTFTQKTSKITSKKGSLKEQYETEITSNTDKKKLSKLLNMLSDLSDVEDLIPSKRTSKKSSKRGSKERSNISSKKSSKRGSKERSIKSSKRIRLTRDLIEEWCELPARGGMKLLDLRDKAESLGIKGAQEMRRFDIERELNKLV